MKILLVNWPFTVSIMKRFLSSNLSTREASFSFSNNKFGLIMVFFFYILCNSQIAYSMCNFVDPEEIREAEKKGISWTSFLCSDQNQNSRQKIIIQSQPIGQSNTNSCEHLPGTQSETLDATLYFDGCGRLVRTAPKSRIRSTILDNVLIK